MSGARPGSEQAQTTGSWRVGTSGWVYPHWKGLFYPQGLSQSAWFQYYTRYFDTVEINNTFYRLPGQKTFDVWREQAPPGFLYAVKANRYLTHIRRLQNCTEPLIRFLDRTRRLGEHLGPILYQLPPRWKPNVARLAAFLDLLPPDLVHVFEFRDPRWFTEPVFELLRQHRVGFCLYHMPTQETPHVVTAPVIYIRFHGMGMLYGGSYPDPILAQWATRIHAWTRAGHQVYAYFNNDAHAHAVHNARRLLELLRQLPETSTTGP